jgi:hypothetical protein
MYFMEEENKWLMHLCFTAEFETREKVAYVSRRLAHGM